MHKSQSTTTMNMQKSNLMRPKMGLSTMTSPQSIKQNRSKLPQISGSQTPAHNNSTLGGANKMEDHYVEKLHNHIQILNDQIHEMKGKQNDFQGSMLNMMTKDKHDFIDNPIDAQEKFKNMKQKLNIVSHELESEQVSLLSEAIALKAKKQYLEELLKHEDQEVSNTVRKQNDLVKEVQDRFQSSASKRQNVLKDVLKLEDQNRQVVDQHAAKKKQRDEKKFREQRLQDLYDNEMALEIEDYEAKVQQFEQLKRDIKQSNDTQGQDIRYVELGDRNKELRNQLAAAESERDRILYDLKECEVRVKLGDEDKDQEANERRRMRDEYTKYLDIYEEIKQRNDKRIEMKVQNSDSQHLRQKKNELSKLERNLKELKEDFRQREKEFEKQTEEMMGKEIHLMKLQEEIQVQERDSAQVFAKLNSIKEDHDTRMGSIADQEETLKRQQREKEYYTEDLRKVEEEHAYLKAKADFLQDHVNLEEELRKVKIDDLKNTIGSNLQFNESIGFLQNNWEEMRKFAKFK